MKKTKINLSKLVRILFSLIIVTGLSIIINSNTTFAATYTVDTTTYAADDGECVIDTTLADAINCADANAGQDTINFGVSGTITITDANLTLDPQSTDSLGIILDCDSNITFSGGAIGGPQLIGPSTVKGCTFDGFVNSLTVTGASATVGGTDPTDKNVFVNWGGSDYAIVAGADNLTIINNWIGTSDGTTSSAGYAGIIVQSSTGTVIGGSTSSERNIIAGLGGSGYCGVQIQIGVGDLTISGNYIGVGTDGTTGFGGIDGICTSNSQTYSGTITIGGGTIGARNIISGNTGTGIHLGDSTFADLQIVNNYIGTTSDGTAAIATSGYEQNTAGIHFDGADSAILGDSVIQRNLISGNGNHGILLTSLASNWQFSANKIGTDVLGTSALANGGSGIECNTCVDNIFGTTDTGIIDGPNTISGNTSHGIYISATGSTGNLISENYIGVNKDANGAIANGSGGIVCNECGILTIGNSSTNFTMNIIAGNTDDGILITSNAGAINIYANAIGNAGANAYANGGAGIKIGGTPTAVITIGSAAASGSNLISGNTGRGIQISDAGSQSHVIKGNRIGVNKNSSSAMSNGSDGILITGSNPNITVGSTTSNEYNIIGGNGDTGITLSGIGATIINNYIGTNTSLADLGNTGAGVLINASTTGAVLGYGFAETLTGLSKANYIGYNGNGSNNDVTIDGASTTTNSLRGNIFELALADSSANTVFNPGAQSGVTNASVSTVVTDAAFTLSLTGLADGSKVDWYTIDGSYTTTFEGTSLIASETTTLSGSFTIGDTAYYQITLANGTSYPLASAGSILSDAPTGLTTFSITNSAGSLKASWTAASSTIFDHYEIWYGTNQTDVENRNLTATEWDNGDDALLATVTTSNSTIVDGTVSLSTPGVTYYAKIWAYNTTGGNSTLSAASYSTGISGGSTGSSSSSSRATTTTTTTTTSDDTTDVDTTVTDENTVTTDENVIVVDTTDTDEDGLTDADEAVYGTDPAYPDTDKDGIKDGAEIKLYKTNPLKPDTDDDGYSDKYEILNIKTDPNDDCDPGDATASEEKLAECVIRLEQKKEQAADELIIDEQVVDEIDEIAIDELLQEIEDELDEENLWMKRHFKNLMQLKSMEVAYSKSQHIRNLVEDFIKNPEQPTRNGEAISIAMAVFAEDIFSDEAIINAESNLPFVDASFERGVLNKIVNYSFSSKAQLQRGNSLRLMFRVSGAKLSKKFGISLYDNFGVGKPVFADVDFGDPSLAYILYFQSKGLLQGYVSGTVRSSDSLSRAEFVKLISMFAVEVQK